MNEDVKEEMAKVKQLCEEGKQSERSVIVEVSALTLFSTPFNVMLGYNI